MQGRTKGGFGLYKGLWWVHSFCVEADGTLIDSSESPNTEEPAVYFGVEWKHVYPLIPKRNAVRCEDLPPVLRDEDCGGIVHSPPIPGNLP